MVSFPKFTAGGGAVEMTSVSEMIPQLVVTSTQYVPVWVAVCEFNVEPSCQR